MRRLHVLPTTALVAASLAACSDSTGSGDRDFEWRGQIAQGDEIEIKGVIGSIQASATSGDSVVVSWTKTSQESELSSVSIQVIPHGDGVTICAVYPDVPGETPNQCLPGNRGNMSVQDNDVRVTFTVSVPAGVVFDGRTVSGDVTAQSISSDAFLRTVNGDVLVSTSGIAEGSTVVGSVTATIGAAEWDRDLDFVTVSGNVTVTVPANTNANVDAAVVTGSIVSDFPLTDVSPGHKQGTLGTGGRTLTLATVTGNITLRSGT